MIQGFKKTEADTDLEKILTQEKIVMKYLSPILDREQTVKQTKYYRDSWMLVQCQETGIVLGILWCAKRVES